MIADLAPMFAHWLAPTLPGGIRAHNQHRTPEFDAYVRDVVKIFRLWHCDKAVREDVFKVILHQRNATFAIGISAGDPIAITMAFGLTARDMCIGLFLCGKLEQAHMLRAHECALRCQGVAAAVQHHVKLVPQLGLDVCRVTPYSGYWAFMPGPPKRDRNGDLLPSAMRPMFVTNIDEARGAVNTWVGENTDPVEVISFVQVLDMLRADSASSLPQSVAFPSSDMA